MVNPFKEVNWNPDLAQRRKFALSLLIGFPCLAALFLLAGFLRGRGWQWIIPAWIAAGGALTGLLLLTVPQIARPFYVAWYFVGCCIGILIGNLVLSVLFFTLFLALGLLMRGLGRRTIRKGFDPQSKSYWQDADPPGDPERYYRQF
jgi:hypothetical protein